MKLNTAVVFLFLLPACGGAFLSNPKGSTTSTSTSTSSTTNGAFLQEQRQNLRQFALQAGFGNVDNKSNKKKRKGQSKLLKALGDDIMNETTVVEEVPDVVSSEDAMAKAIEAELKQRSILAARLDFDAKAKASVSNGVTTVGVPEETIEEPTIGVFEDTIDQPPIENPIAADEAVMEDMDVENDEDLVSQVLEKEEELRKVMMERDHVSNDLIEVKDKLSELGDILARNNDDIAMLRQCNADQEVQIKELAASLDRSKAEATEEIAQIMQESKAKEIALNDQIGVLEADLSDLKQSTDKEIGQLKKDVEGKAALEQTCEELVGKLSTFQKEKEEEISKLQIEAENKQEILKQKNAYLEGILEDTEEKIAKVEERAAQIEAEAKEKVQRQIEQSKKTEKNMKAVMGTTKTQMKQKVWDMENKMKKVDLKYAKTKRELDKQKLSVETQLKTLQETEQAKVDAAMEKLEATEKQLAEVEEKGKDRMKRIVSAFGRRLTRRAIRAKAEMEELSDSLAEEYAVEKEAELEKLKAKMLEEFKLEKEAELEQLRAELTKVEDEENEKEDKTPSSGIMSLFKSFDKKKKKKGIDDISKLVAEAEEIAAEVEKITTTSAKPDDTLPPSMFFATLGPPKLTKTVTAEKIQEKVAYIKRIKAEVAAEEEAARIAAAENEAKVAKLKAEEEERARIAAEEEAKAAKIKAEEEEKARIAAEEEAKAAKLKAEEEEKARIAAEKAAEEERLRVEAEQEAARIKAEEEEKARIAAEEETARLKAEEEEKARIAAEEEEAARLKAEEEEKARIAAEEEAARIKVEEEEKARIAAEEEEAARLKAEEEEKARIAAEEEEAARVKAEEEEKARIAAEEEAARIKAEEEEKARIAAEEEEAARLKAEEEEKARIAAEEEAARVKAEEEEKARIAAEEEEAARIKAEEEEKARIAAEEEAASKFVNDSAPLMPGMPVAAEPIAAVDNLQVSVPTTETPVGDVPVAEEMPEEPKPVSEAIDLEAMEQQFEAIQDVPAASSEATVSEQVPYVDIPLPITSDPAPVEATVPSTEQVSSVDATIPPEATVPSTDQPAPVEATVPVEAAVPEVAPQTQEEEPPKPLFVSGQIVAQRKQVRYAASPFEIEERHYFQAQDEFNLSPLGQRDIILRSPSGGVFALEGLGEDEAKWSSTYLLALYCAAHPQLVQGFGMQFKSRTSISPITAVIAAGMASQSNASNNAPIPAGLTKILITDDDETMLQRSIGNLGKAGLPPTCIELGLLDYNKQVPRAMASKFAFILGCDSAEGQVDSLARFVSSSLKRTGGSGKFVYVAQQNDSTMGYMQERLATSFRFQARFENVSLVERKLTPIMQDTIEAIRSHREREGSFVEGEEPIEQGYTIMLGRHNPNQNIGFNGEIAFSDINKRY